jgi:hypothetical protein
MAKKARFDTDPVKLPDLNAVILLSPDQLQQVVDEKTGGGVSQIQNAALRVNKAGGGTEMLIAGLCTEVFGYEWVEELVPITGKVQLRIGGCLHGYELVSSHSCCIVLTSGGQRESRPCDVTHCN